MKTLKIGSKLLVGVVGFMSLFLGKVVVAVQTGNPEVLKNIRVPAPVDQKTLEAYRSVIRDACGKFSDIVEVKYHAEKKTVDLSDFDGCAVTVRTDAMEMEPPNLE